MHTITKRGACIFPIRNRYGIEVLLQLRSPDAWVYANHWAAIGGAVEQGESPSAAVRRECVEEVGCLPFGYELVLFDVALHLKGGRRVQDHTFIMYWPQWRQPHLRDEGQKIRWFSLADALKLRKLPPHEKSILIGLSVMELNQLAYSVIN